MKSRSLRGEALRLRGERNSPLPIKTRMSRVDNRPRPINLTLYLSRVRRLTAGHKLALLIVASCVRARSPCQLRVGQWAVSLACTPRWAFRLLGDLERWGWLRITRRWRYTPNLYAPGPRLSAVLSKLLMEGKDGHAK